MRRFARRLLLTPTPLVLLPACQREGAGGRTGRSIDRMTR